MAAGREPEPFARNGVRVQDGVLGLFVFLFVLFVYITSDPNTFAKTKLRSSLTTLWQWRSFARRHYSIVCIPHSTLSFPTPTFPSIPITIPRLLFAANRAGNCTASRAAVKTGPSMILLPQHRRPLILIILLQQLSIYRVMIRRSDPFPWNNAWERHAYAGRSVQPRWGRYTS